MKKLSENLCKLYALEGILNKKSILKKWAIECMERTIITNQHIP